MKTYKGYTIEKANAPIPGYEGCYEHDIYSQDGVMAGHGIQLQRSVLEN